MDRRSRYIICLLSVTACLASSCNYKGLDIGSKELPENAIRVDGVDADEMTVSVSTRANTDAEKVSWLLQPLKNGLDITYGLYGVTDTHQDVAILKLTDEATTPATYTFKYRADRKATVGDGNDAIWYNNGEHYFQGVHVPERIRYTSSDISDVEGSDKAPGLTSDQHNAADTGTDAELGNYTLLSHYLGMPANYRLTATVERIKLPFRHRLARVVAFVLIDPELHTTLKGYKKDASGAAATTEDPTTTSFRFSHVQVLQGVKDVVESGGHHVLTPKWVEARKVIPHFDGERGSYNYSTQTLLDENFKYYYKEDDGTIKDLYPTSSGWSAAHNAANHNGYTEVIYGKVPVYDIIVRPTYTSVDNVMYDEEGYTVGSSTSKTNLANQTNQIVFEIELENGLQYQKTFEFDLNANYQTVVYLRINRERVDYNASGSELWVESKNSDGWFGINNENGNTLSKAGSSWQRAYTYLNAFFSEDGYWTDTDGTVYPNGVTDGQFYNANKNDSDNAQYYTSGYATQFVEKFMQAYEHGPHHGDYFILQQNLEIDARMIPENFVFTGHLDAQDNTISLTHVNKPVYKEAENISGQLYTRTGESLAEWNYTAWEIPTLYVKHVTPATYWQESELQYVEADDKWYEPGTITWIEDIHYTQDEADALNKPNLIPYVETPAVYYTQEECDEENSKPEHHPYTLVADEGGRQPGEEGYIETREYDMENYVDGYEPLTIDKIKTPAVEIQPGEDGYVPTYEPGYTPITTADIKTPAHWDTSAGVAHEPGSEKTPEIVTYPLATESTDPTYPATLTQLQTAEYYTDDHSGTRFVCPDLYQYSHNSPAYLFAGLNGDYTTNQESGRTPWEANVHRETNKTTRWVPTPGYRAEVLNAVMASPYKLFKDGASITGNVQNSFNMNSDGTKTAVTHTPDIPQYK